MTSQIRIGHGYDVHAFTEGTELVLGAEKIPFHRAFEAHSDGDVLIHAICDALLGALALGDIGTFFPPSDDRWKNCSSDVFLREIHSKIQKKSYQIANIDSTVVCEKPKLRPHIDKMRANIAEILQEPLDKISIKATTTEKLGFCGREEGIAVHAVCLLTKMD